MTTRNVPAYEALASDIKNLGTECVFGLMSDDTALFIATLDSMGVKFHGARHENNAAAMAEGYASATGKLGIAILGRGPATANGMNGTMYAQRSGSRVLIIMGEASTANVAPNGSGPDPKSLNALPMLQGIGIRTFLATAAQTVRHTLAQAVAATHQGAVALLLPANVQFGVIDTESTVPGQVATPVTSKAPARAAAIRSAAAILKDSRRPLIVAGLGAHRAGAREAIIALADHTGAALATSMKGKDMFRGHPFNCGVVGSFSLGGGRRLIEQADCIVAFGAGLNQRTTSFGTSMPADVPLIHVDSDRLKVGRWFHADVGVVGDARQVAEQLLAALPPRSDAEKPLRSDDMRRWLADFDPASEFEAAATPRTLDPRSLGIELDRLLPANRNVVYDSGNFLSILPYLSTPGPANVKMTSDSASIGMGFGTALGFARGTPDRTTVLVVGDGAFLMTMGELETVVREDIPLVIVLMNDCAYGAELHYLKMRGMPVALSQFPDIDFAPVAEAFGFQAATVRTLDELRALEPMLSNPDGPILIDCKINASIAAPFLSESIEAERRKG